MALQKDISSGDYSIVYELVITFRLVRHKEFQNTTLMCVFVGLHSVDDFLT
jgi:hypothetical protein